jgi:multisubunit Na+/H+ antiporter MnhC subunit
MTFPLTAALLITAAVLAQAIAFFVTFKIRRKRDAEAETQSD